MGTLMRRSFARDERGTITTFVLVCSVAFFLLAGFVIDFGRVFSTHSQMQGYVDAVALAAARELDGEDDAIDRAEGVIKSAMITFATSFAESGDEDFSVESYYFLTEQPKGVTGGITKSDFAHLITNDPVEAQHVLVYTELRKVPWTLLAFQGTGPAKPGTNIRTVAAASNRVSACAEPLLAICAPADGSWENIDPGQQMFLTKNRNTSWSTGEYGVVSDIADDVGGTCSHLSGPAHIACLLAIDTHNTQCSTDLTVDFEADPLDVDGLDTLDVHAGLNTRFGIFDEGLGALAVSSEISADTNNIAGELLTCTGEALTEVADTMALPRDGCFHSGTCSHVGPNAVEWSQLELYWQHMHGGPLPAGIETRHDVYMYEIQNNLADVGAEGGSQYAGAMCNPNSNGRASRRTFEVAIVDCTGLNQLGVVEHDVIEYAEVFLTEPVATTEHFIADFDTPRNGHIFARGQELDANLVGATEIETTDEDGEEITTYEITGPGTCRWGNSTGGAGSDVQGAVCPESESLRPYADVGLTFTVQQSLRSIEDERAPERNHPILFDTNATDHQDPDLMHTQFGHIMVISEDGNTTNPNDEWRGGWIIMEFSEPTYVESLTLFDADRGGVIRIYDEPLDSPPYGEYWTNGGGNLMPESRETRGHDTREDARVTVPRMHDGEHIKIGVQRADVRTIAYYLPNSGGIDNIEFTNSLTRLATDRPNRDDMFVEFVDFIDTDDRRMSRSTRLSR